MDRRTLLTAIVAAANIDPAGEVQRRQRPWHKRAEELFEREGMYCDYAAWLEWFPQRLRETMRDAPEIIDILDEEDNLLTIYVYSLCCELADGGQTPVTPVDTTNPFE